MPIAARQRAFGRKAWSLTAVVASLSSGSPARAVDDAKLKAYGQHLARECTTCHRLDGVDNGIPSIVGWPVDMFISTVKFYSEGARTNPVMVSVASSLSDDQLKALAHFFASVPKPQKSTAPAGHGKRKP